MKRQQLMALLSARFDEEVYIDYAPNSAEPPYVVFNHINNNRSQRNLDNSLAGKSDTWRVTVYGQDRIDCDRLMNNLESVDNTSNADFQRVNIINVADDSDLPEMDFSRSFVDLETYDR